MDHDFRAIPIFRIFDRAKALEFYVGFLGMAVDREHRFEPTLPVSRETRVYDPFGNRLHFTENPRRPART